LSNTANGIVHVVAGSTDDSSRGMGYKRDKKDSLPTKYIGQPPEQKQE
jgi:hypothetical protein